VSKETYIRGKRVLVYRQKRPTITGIPEVRTSGKETHIRSSIDMHNNDEGERFMK
jgi:hypothetical protein